MDLFVAQGTERSLRPDRLLLLGYLEFLEEYPSGESPSSAYFNPSEKLVAASAGFDIPPFKSWLDFPTWAEEGPPKGTNYWYPPRDDVIPSISGYPAPLNVGTQMYAQAIMTKMIAKCTQQKRSIEDSMNWAESEIEGFMRT